MPINITDELHAATTKGKIASAKEVFLTGDTENLQQIGEKTHQLEDSIKNIAATGGASTAVAVTFDNAASGMTAVNAQGAIEELNTKNKSQDVELSKKANATDVTSQMQAEKSRVNAELNKKFDKEYISQELGKGEDKVMSQKVVSNKLSDLELKICDFDCGECTDLTDAISKIPKAEQKGGLRIRFTKDGNVVSYNLIDSSFSTNIDKWFPSHLEGNVFNINDYVGDKVYTSTEARNSVPSLLRKNGLIITYKTVDGWVTEQYISEYPKSETWATDSYWKEYATSTDIIRTKDYVNNKGQFINVDVLIPLVSGNYTLSTAIGALWKNYQELCKKGTIITFYKGDNNWIIYQFIGTDNTPIESQWLNVNLWDRYIFPSVYRVLPEEGTSRINSILWGNPNGCTIELFEGVYEGDAINFTNGGSKICNNCLIVGKGVNTIIKNTNSVGNDILAKMGENNIIKNLSLYFGYIRNGIKNLNVKDCFVKGVYFDDSQKSCHDIKIAAYNSTESAKQNADMICSETAADIIINAAINSLPNGGSIFLAVGDYACSSYINLKNKNNISLKGCGYNTYLYRSGGYAIIGDTASNCCISEVRYNSINVSKDNFVFNTWEDNIFKLQEEDNVIPVNPLQGIAGINTAITSLGIGGGKIKLYAGTYSGTSGINFTGSNVIIEGVGAATIINRDTKTNDVFSNTPSAKNNILRDVKLANTYQQSGTYPTEHYKLVNVVVENICINQDSNGNNIINIGDGYFYKTLSAPYGIISKNNWTYPTRFEFHIYGKIKETKVFGVGKPISIIGHNALIEFNGYKNCHINFGNVPDVFMEDMNMHYAIFVKDIHFLRTGCFNYRDEPCVFVESNSIKFENCIFENASSSPSPFNNQTQGVTVEDDNGCRRHGITITIDKFGKDCKAEFYNCVGIGSPYGFQSTRGWYISGGSPKLFNCIGYGGGIGEFGHGIISHRASHATLENCIAYAGEHTYRQGAGFRFQSHGSNDMIGCIGYGSKGIQMKSDGVAEETILKYCKDLGISDTSFLYNEGVFSYANMTPKTTDDGYNESRILLGCNIKNSDVRLVELNNVSEEGYGISMWAHDGEPMLINCKGFSGHGKNSIGLHIIDKSAPLIQGGYYGTSKEMFKQYLIKESDGRCHINIPSYIISQYTPYKISSVSLTITGIKYKERHLKLHLETQNGNEIIVPSDIYMTASIYSPIINSVNCDAGSSMIAYFTEGDNDTPILDYDDKYFYFIITIKPLCGGETALYIGDSASPNIQNVIFSSTAQGIKINTDSAKYSINDCSILSESNAIVTDKQNIRIFNSQLKGDVDKAILFAEKQSVNGSSNYRI